MSNFTASLEFKIAETGLPICMGIDPHFDALPEFLRNAKQAEGDITILARFSTIMVDVAAEYFPAVKFQSAFYESYGWQGIKVLQEAIAHAKKLGLLVILDAKRGDIASTMKAYGKMAFECLQADCLTVTPYMGIDVMSPLEPWLKSGKGIYLVWLGSNTTADAFFFWPLMAGSKIVGDALLTMYQDFVDRQNLLGSVGLVLGATMLPKIDPELLERAARFPLLLPGVGPQGGEIDGRTIKLLRSGKHLLPLSRSLAGLGDPAHEAALSHVTGWDGYQSFVDLRCQITAKEHREACN